MYGEFGGGGEGAPRPHLPRKRAPFSAKTPCARKQPIKQPTEMPCSTMALMGRFASLMGRFPALMGRFPDFVLRGRFTSRKSSGKQPITGWPRFGSVRLRFAHGTVRAVPVRAESFKGFCAFQHSLGGWHGSSSGFGSEKRFRQFRFRFWVLGKTVPMVPVSGSGSVLAPFCH